MPMTLLEAASKSSGTIVHIGDSNTNGRPGHRTAYEREWLPRGGVLHGWTSYNIGQNGSVLADWASREIANCSDPQYSSLPPADFTPTNQPGNGALARCINANPDIIRVRLGTNDLNSPANRASIGREDALLGNLTKLVDFLLQKTKAVIWLCLPQPFEPSNFLGVTQWADAAEARDASARLRRVYLSFVGRDRVSVFDSHAEVYGFSCDDRAQDAQDSLGKGPLIEDSLHPTNLGFRREVQAQARQLAGYKAAPAFEPSPMPAEVTRNAVWGVTLWTSGLPRAGGTSATIDTDLSQDASVAKQASGRIMLNGDALEVPLSNLSGVDVLQSIGCVSAFGQIMSVPDKKRLWAYSHTTGAIHQLTEFRLSQVVTNVSYPYAQFYVEASDLTGFGGGRITFYTIDPLNVPFKTFRTISAQTTGPDIPIMLGTGGFTIRSARVIRKPTANGVTLTLYLQNQSDGRYVTATENVASPGKPIGTFTLVSNYAPGTMVFAAGYDGEAIIGSSDWCFLKLTNGQQADLGGFLQVCISDNA